MAENLKEVIARLKAQQSSPKSEPKAVPTPEPLEIEEEEDEDEEISEEPQKPLTQKKVEKVEKEVDEIDKQREQILMEIEMLQNNGRYRVEMLHQMQEMNRALVVISSILADISGGRK
jgi:molecular chaperone GrpE (heat shock protein)